MSHENVEIVRRLNAAFNRRDREAMFAMYHPDVEWCDLQHAPDAPERLHGVSTVRAYLDQWYEAFDGFTADIEQYIDAGQFVVTLTHWLATGKGSALAVDLHTADVVELAEGRIVQVTIGYADKSAALKAVGMAE